MSLLAWLLVLTVSLSVPQDRQQRPRGMDRQLEESPGQGLRLFVAGEAVITRPWSDRDDPSFTALIDKMRAADATVVQLQMVLHTFENVYPERYTGQGTPLAAEPRIAKQLQWAGIDVVSNAHDHTYDYGALGVLTTQRHVEGVGIAVAGTGPNLRHARRPAFHYGRNGFVGVVAASTSYLSWGVATPSRPDLHGKPGLNPLRVRIRTRDTITAAAAEELVQLAVDEGIDGVAIEDTQDGPTLEFLGKSYSIGETSGRLHAGRVTAGDLEANLEAIRKADVDADAVVFTLHANHPGPWLQDVAHQAIDAGADVVVVHGAPGIRGVEIHAKRPILYGLGRFVFQEETVARLPAEYLEYLGFEADTPAETVLQARAGHWDDHVYWESLAATVRFADGAVQEVGLIPLSLGFGEGFGARGTPRLADPELGAKLIARAAELSQEYGTEIQYDASTNLGRVVVP